MSYTEEEAFKAKPARVEELIPTDYAGRYILVRTSEDDINEWLDKLEREHE